MGGDAFRKGFSFQVAKKSILMGRAFGQIPEVLGSNGS